MNPGPRLGAFGI